MERITFTKKKADEQRQVNKKPKALLRPPLGENRECHKIRVPTD